MRNLVDWVFLTHQLCRGMRPTNDASTGFQKVSVVNKCVELVFTNTDDTDKIYGVLSRNDVFNRLKDHKVDVTCKDINVLLTNTKFDIPELCTKKQKREFISCKSLSEYIRCFRDCLV